MKFDLSLYLIISPKTKDKNYLKIAKQAIKGGVTIIQYRKDKFFNIKLVKKLKKLAIKNNIKFIINNDLKLSKKTNSDGIHLGQDDIKVKKARKQLGLNKIIGLTVRSKKQAKKADLKKLDYISIGGVFATKSKKLMTKSIGLKGLAKIVKIIRKRDKKIKICAIAGIDLTNLKSIMKQNIDGVAIISGISNAKNPRLVARKMIKVIK